MYKLRIKIFLGILAGVWLVLTAKLVHLQVIRGQSYRRMAEEAMRRVDVLPVMRGKITDRRGRILALDDPCFDLCLHYRFLTADKEWISRQQRLAVRRKGITRADAEELYQGLSEFTWATAREHAERRGVDLDRAVERIIKRVQTVRRIVNLKSAAEITVRDEEQYHPVVTGLEEQEALKLKTQVERMIGAEVRSSHRRWYPYGHDACHVIGMTGEVWPEEVEKLNLKAGEADWLTRMRANYLPGDTIGRAGLEKTCERLLRGRRGYRRYRLSGETLREEPTVQGADVHLTLDIVLQRKLAELVATKAHTGTGYTGSAVVLSIGTRESPQCEVLAMVSVPTYDLNTYVQEFSKHVADVVRLPLRHRAVTQRYQPGSTIKPVVVLAGLGTGVVGLRDAITCRRDPTATSFRCWSWSSGFDHGPQDVVDALKHSCNPYFCEVGRRMGVRRLCDWLIMFGFAEKPGMGLSVECAGTVPTEQWLLGKGEQWLRGRQRYPQLYFPGDVKNISIGQGMLTATPVHVANAMATIARDGVFLTPMLVLEGGPRQVRRDLPLAPAHVQAVQEGMHKVVNERGGTAWKYFHSADAAPLEGIEVCGKTGTATTAPQRIDSNNNGRIDREDQIVRRGDTAWFVGFVPYGRPQIAFAVAIEYVEGGGGRNAVPVARELVRLCQELGYVR
ncbi:MAG: penicillin-binding transpeptidase domain-containing protein [Phycisphaerae bacterium]